MVTAALKGLTAGPASPSIYRAGEVLVRLYSL